MQTDWREGLLAMTRRHREPPALYAPGLLGPAPPCDAGRCARDDGPEDGHAPAPIPRAPPARILHPSHGLRIALDPRIPRDRQRFRFRLAPDDALVVVRWTLDGRRLAYTPGPDLLWRLEPGPHRLGAEVLRTGEPGWRAAAEVPFVVMDDGRGRRSGPRRPASDGGEVEA